MSHDEQPNLNPENSNPGWKDRDINMRIVIWSTTVVFAVALFTMVAMFFLVKRLNEREMYVKGEAAERVLPEGDVLLQVNAAQDLTTYLDNEALVLNGYAPVEGAEGYVRIPIEAAKKQMLAKGFAARDVEVPAVFRKPAAASSGHAAEGHAKPAVKAHAPHDSHEGHSH